MARQQCVLLGNTRQIYHIDASGNVWNRAEGGTAWADKAQFMEDQGYWIHQSGKSVLLLLPVLPARSSLAVSYGSKATVQGLRPATSAVLEYDKARCKEIGEAMLRYATAMKPIPEDWLTELQELTERNQPETQTPESLH